MLPMCCPWQGPLLQTSAPLRCCCSTQKHPCQAADAPAVCSTCAPSLRKVVLREAVLMHG